MTETSKGLAPGSSQNTACNFDFASCGRVVISPLDPGYDGATRASNNTGELTALLRAVRWEAAQGGDTPVCFRVDSVYAISMATGRWAPRRKNRELARRLQVEYARLRASRGYGAVSVTHVRAHTRVRGNEAADAMAKYAAEHGARSGADALSVLQELLREMDSPSASPPPAPTGRRPTSTSSSSSTRGLNHVVSIAPLPHSLGVG